MASIGLLFGSFNPIHTGHLIIAEYFATQGECERVELVVSPQNPLKQNTDLADEKHRLAMVRLAVRGNVLIKANSMELSMSRPSYTYRTLSRIAKRNPQHTYKLIIGSDNLDRFKEWKDWESILNEYQVLVYRRPGYHGSEFEQHPNVKMFDDIPLLHISSTYIRDCLRKKLSVKYLVPDAVLRYAEQHGVYA